jgi:hypothetical protein
MSALVLGKTRADKGIRQDYKLWADGFAQQAQD